MREPPQNLHYRYTRTRKQLKRETIKLDRELIENKKIYMETKSPNVHGFFKKPSFNKEIADIAQAYEAEYKESKENDMESIAKRGGGTDAFNSETKKVVEEKSIQTGQKADRKQKDIDRNKESKSARLFEKPSFNKEIANIVQAYEAEYKEYKENDMESVAKRVGGTDAFDSKDKKIAEERIYQIGQNTEREQKAINRYNKFKGAQLCDKPDFSKEIADIVQAYEAEYKESKESEKESVAKRLDVTDAFDGDFAPEIFSLLENDLDDPDKSMHEHTVFRRRQNFGEGLEKFSESVVGTILEHISESDRIKPTQESRTYHNEFVNGTERVDRNTGVSIELISDLTLVVFGNAETTVLERYHEAPDIERELKAEDAQVLNAGDSREIGIERSATSKPDAQEAGALEVFPQVDSEADEESSDEKLSGDLRHCTHEVPSDTLPVIAYYDDDDSGLSPCFGILPCTARVKFMPLGEEQTKD